MDDFVDYSGSKASFFAQTPPCLILLCFASIRKNDPTSMHIQFITTGGTIDKIYFDALSQFEVGDSQVKAMLTDALVDFSYEITAIMKKDSLDITDGDRATIRAHIEASEHSHFIVTHGTDTMPETAAALRGIENKTVVLTGALTPARVRTTDAVFNIGMAVGAVQTASPGVYIAMSGQVFEAGQVRKNREANRFESTLDEHEGL